MPRPAAPASAVQLSPRAWAAAIVVCVALFALLPWLSPLGGAFIPGPDFRVPDRLSEDYWLFRQYSAAASGRRAVLVLGDSVAWGRFVKPAATLTHRLNECAGAPRFANLAVNGTHPVALAGLVRYYGGAIAGRDVLLVVNLAWLASPAADLRGDREARFNHPRLVPQFFPRIASYAEPPSGRLGVVVERHLAVFSWARHIAGVRFDNLGLQEWSLQHPYSLPALFGPAETLTAEDDLHPGAKPWHAASQPRRALAWVDAATSLQWQACRDLVDLLRRRGNRVQVVVTPLNEHMMDADSLAAYRRLVDVVTAWCRAQGVACRTPGLLPSDVYADLSHPLADGYATLASETFPGLDADGQAPAAGGYDDD